MNKRHVVFTLIVVAGFSSALGWFLATNPPLPPARSIILEVAHLPSSDSVSRRCTILVSNASNYSVEYAEGFNKIWFEIAYVSNGVWQTYEVRTPGVGSFLLAPHAVVKDTVKVPETTSVFKVGLHITSLTWRGRFAFRMFGSKIGRHLGPLMGFLLVQDEKKRSRTEWSDEQNVTHLWKGN